jgi:hypothetical protein
MHTTILFVVMGAAILGVNAVFATTANASLLLTLAFWLAVFQGSITLVAAAELAQGKWIIPLKKPLLAMRPMILLCGLLFVGMAAHWEIYPPAIRESPWFDKHFFVARNVVFVVIAYFFACLYARASLKESQWKGHFAVAYILVFVTMQSLVAFNWLMPLQFPWVSTILGPYCFVEAVYLGIAFAGIVCFVLHRKAGEQKPKELAKTQYDTGLMLYGFCILWTSLFFTQLIIIWYGNIPEEQAPYIVFYHHYHPMPWIIFGLLSVLPFTILLFRRCKANTNLVAALSLVVLCGVMLERWLFCVPVAAISYPALALEVILMAATAVLLLKRHFAENG